MRFQLLQIGKFEDCPTPERDAREEEVEDINNGEALHRTAPAESSGTPNAGMGDQNREIALCFGDDGGE